MKKIFHLLPTFFLLPLLLFGTACVREESGNVLPSVTVTEEENTPAVSAVSPLLRFVASSSYGHSAFVPHG